MRVRGKGEGDRTTRFYLAVEEASRIEEDAPALLDRAAGVDWYHRPGSAIDVVAAELCRLRRARAGELGGAVHGDEAVRAILAKATPEAVIWLASRAVSYMDETGFPESVEEYVG